MPNTYYNVTSSNNTLALIDNGISRIVTITAGIYNANTIAVALQSALTTASPQTWTVSFSLITGLMSFTSTTVFTLLSFVTNLLPLIGYPAGVYPSVGSGISYRSTSPNIVSMDTNLSVNIRISNCSTRVTDSNGFSSSFNMPFTQTLGGGIELFQPDYSSNPIVLHFDTPQRSLQISLYDVTGRQLLLLADWEMVLEQC